MILNNISLSLYGNLNNIKSKYSDMGISDSEGNYVQFFALDFTYQELQFPCSLMFVEVLIVFESITQLWLAVSRNFESSRSLKHSKISDLKIWRTTQLLQSYCQRQLLQWHTLNLLRVNLCSALAVNTIYEQCVLWHISERKILVSRQISTL